MADDFSPDPHPLSGARKSDLAASKATPTADCAPPVIGEPNYIPNTEQPPPSRVKFYLLILQASGMGAIQCIDRRRRDRKDEERCLKRRGPRLPRSEPGPSASVIPPLLRCGGAGNELGIEVHQAFQSADASELSIGGVPRLGLPRTGDQQPIGFRVASM